MSKYEVLFPNKRTKNKFRKIMENISSQERERIIEKIHDLSLEPHPQSKSFKYLRPPVQVYELTAQYRIRAGDYRILYDVDERERKVWILALRKKGKRTYR